MKLTHLQQLEAEAIHIMREVVAQFERPALLFSGGKDSICLVKLAEKAFWPAKIPFPLVHIDTGHNFPEAIAYRDELVAEWIARGYVVPLERGYGITAVERRSAPPYSMVNRYPDGWRTTVVGPNIHHWHCPKPQWLAEYEGDVPPAASMRTK